MPIHAYIIPIHIYTHTHAHFHIYIHVHTHIAVHVYIAFRLLMEGGMVRVYRILRVMPQPAINIAKICFVTNYGKLRNYNFFKQQYFVPLAWGYLWAIDMPLQIPTRPLYYYIPRKEWRSYYLAI